MNLDIVITVIKRAKIKNVVGTTVASELNLPFFAPTIDGSTSNKAIHKISYTPQITENIIIIFLFEFGNINKDMAKIQLNKATAINP